jgi:hypothetical protein
LEACITTSKRHNKELKAKLTELDSDQKKKTKVTNTASKAKNNVYAEQQANCQKVHVIITVATSELELHYRKAEAAE